MAQHYTSISINKNIYHTSNSPCLNARRGISVPWSKSLWKIFWLRKDSQAIRKAKPLRVHQLSN